jgi:hypothetical protein
MVGHTGFEPHLKAGQSRFLPNQVWQWLLEVEALRQQVGMRTSAHPNRLTEW